jgi:hypothetical protein
MSLQNLAFSSLQDFSIQDVLTTIQKKPIPQVDPGESLEYLLKELKFYPQIPIENKYVFTIKDLLTHLVLKI